MNLLITGSRNIKTKEKFCVRKVNEIISFLNSEDMIIVGDAEGIDTLVVYRCYLNKIKCSCYGAYKRNKLEFTYRNCSWINLVELDCDYLGRDDIMVDMSDKCIALWDGESRGTKYTYDKAVEKGLPSMIINI